MSSERLGSSCVLSSLDSSGAPSITCLHHRPLVYLPVLHLVHLIKVLPVRDTNVRLIRCRALSVC
uniref:Uncharacterized protein n=1 Tax=Arion vulgaris TaxID=1028688 RepID=A0A0B7B4U4_9EUPU